MFSYRPTFNSEVSSCHVSVLEKKFDCSFNGVAAAVSCVGEYIEYFIHCETAVDFAQLIGYVTVRPLSTVEYTSVASVFHCIRGLT